jgi:acyl carrier protein
LRPVELQDLRECFAEVIDLTGVELRRQAVLGDDVPVDSMEMLRILSRIEARYGFRFGPQVVLQLVTVGDLLDAARGIIK